MIRLLFLLLFSVAIVRAHPVAQGSLDLDLRADHVLVRARVSNEQVFVASTFQPAQTPAPDLESVFRQHGGYMLQHLHLRHGTQRLEGGVEQVKIPEDRTTNGFAIYELRYAFAEQPTELSVAQDLLQEIEFAPGVRWTASFSVTLRRSGELLREGLLLTHTEPLAVSFPAQAGATLDRAGLFTSYLRHGVGHILEGWDHLLFMAALVLAVTSLWDLVKVVTAFTVAHTLTLALSTFDLVRLPSSFVEPMIALSIVVVAVQNLAFPQSARGGSRLLVAFAFGLFHGLGFAGGLLEAMQEMSTAAVSIALAGFSVGVELGHQVVVIPIFLVMVLLRRRRAESGVPAALPILRYGSVLIAVAGCAYFGLALRG